MDSPYDVFNDFASLYQTKYGDTSAYFDSFDVFCRELTTADARVLELGCGPGNATAYLLRKRPDFQILGLDLSENMVALARQNNPDATFEVGDCRDLSRFQGGFHGVFCAFVLPYLSQEETQSLFSEAWRLLLPGGCVYVSTMEGEPDQSGWQTSSTGRSLFIHNHSQTSLTLALNGAGFEIHWLDRASQFGSKDLVCVAKKPV